MGGITAGVKALNSSPFWLNTNEPDTSVVLAPFESRGPISMSASQRGPLVITDFGASFTGKCKIRMFHNGMPLQNTDILMSTIFGNSGSADTRMYRLTEPIVLAGLDALDVNLSDISGSTNTVMLTHLASRYGFAPNDADFKPLNLKPGSHQMFYTLDDGTVTVPPATTVEKFITISGDHHFQIETKTLVFTPSPPFDFQIDIIDTATGSSIFSAPGEKHNPVFTKLAFGSASYPMRYVEPITVYAGMKLKVIMVGGADEITVDLTLGGRAIINGRAV